MKNGELIVRGKRADELIIEDFKTSDDMTYWEFGEDEIPSVYDVYDNRYGKDACERDDICDFLDLFGEEFHKKFYGHKRKLVAQRTLIQFYAERDRLNELINSYEQDLLK